MRIFRSVVLALAMLIPLAATPARAQGIPDLPPAAVHAVVQVSDTVAAPTGPIGDVSGLQMLIVAALGSLITWLVSHAWSGFSDLGLVGKYAVLYLSTLVVTFAVNQFHGTVAPDVTGAGQMALQSLLAAIASGGVFKLATTKPAT